MPHRSLPPLLLFALLIAPCCLFAAGSTARNHKAVAQQPTPVAPPPAPPQPLQPLSLQQMPASPPKVTYQNGQLSITAENSTLGDILHAVQAQTGASIEMPGNPPERVVIHLGPGPARDVLADLLNGSHFNYVVVGSTADPNKIQRVVLTAKTAGETSPSAPAAANSSAFNPPRVGFSPTTADTMSDDDSDDAPDSATPTPEQPAPSADQETPNQPPNGGPGVKTPEQLLQELQRQQQQMQQQQQQGQQPGQPAAPPPPGRPQ